MRALEFMSNLDWVAALGGIAQRIGGKELFICPIPDGWGGANGVFRKLRRAGCNPSWYTSKRMGDDLYICVDDAKRAASVLAG